MANQGQISPAKRILKLHQLWEQDLGDSRQSRDGCLMARNLANFPRWNYVFNPQNLDEKIWTYESITNFVDDFRVSLFCWRNHFERNLHFFVYCTYCIIIQFLWELLEWESSHQLRQRKAWPSHVNQILGCISSVRVNSNRSNLDLPSSGHIICVNHQRLQNIISGVSS